MDAKLERLKAILHQVDEARHALRDLETEAMDTDSLPYPLRQAILWPCGPLGEAIVSLRQTVDRVAFHLGEEP